MCDADRPFLRGFALGADPVAEVLAAATHRALSQSYVERHLTDPGLSAPQVAAAAGISVRHLSRVFAAAGTRIR
ncbi:hypothetical protein [Pseudonocardia sp. NPDC046786]|uniref:hypothetical protein n=1 Tax=Pseudonocardia sp. NPDC046786 TaxID=3155471 RepID=UPI0033D84DA9